MQRRIPAAGTGTGVGVQCRSGREHLGWDREAVRGVWPVREPTPRQAVCRHAHVSTVAAAPGTVAVRLAGPAITYSWPPFLPYRFFRYSGWLYRIRIYEICQRITIDHVTPAVRSYGQPREEDHSDRH